VESGAAATDWLGVGSEDCDAENGAVQPLSVRLSAKNREKRPLAIVRPYQPPTWVLL